MTTIWESYPFTVPSLLLPAAAQLESGTALNLCKTDCEIDDPPVGSHTESRPGVEATQEPSTPLTQHRKLTTQSLHEIEYRALMLVLERHYCDGPTESDPSYTIPIYWYRANQVPMLALPLTN